MAKSLRRSSASSIRDAPADYAQKHFLDHILGKMRISRDVAGDSVKPSGVGSDESLNGPRIAPEAPLEKFFQRIHELRPPASYKHHST